MYKYFDLDKLPILSRGRRTLMVSSYDRQYENKDWGNYLYDIAENTSVIFDDPGCGCIKSIWMAVPSTEAFMDFYFDGEDTPRYTSSLFGFFNGECAELSGIGNTFEERGHWELADCRCGNCFIQIPYENGLKIVVRGEEKEKCYYHIMYESYPDGVLREEGDRKIFEDAFSAEWKPQAELKAYTVEKPYNDLMTIEGAGVVREMTLRAREDEDLTKVMFYICWDDSRIPQVSCPMSDIFAQPVRFEDINSYVVSSKKEDGYVTTSFRLPMPFFKKAYIGVINISGQKHEFEFGVVIGENNYDKAETGYFYADYKAGPTVLFSDWNIGEFGGHGHVVGLIQSCVNGVGGSYCEGNEHFYINGEKSPSINGTGTEDIYLGCYWPNMKFDSPCAGCVNDVYIEANNDLSKCLNYPIMYYRYYLDMPIAFDCGIKLDVQHGAVCQNFSDYTTTCLSYRKDENLFEQTDYIKLSNEVSRKMHEYASDGCEYALTGKLESDMRPAEVTETGYKTEGGKVSFKIAVKAENEGVILRRLYDQSVSNANAKVYVDGKYVGIWNCCNINTYFAFADSDFHIPAKYTSGKKELSVEVRSEGIYTDFEYTVLS